MQVCQVLASSSFNMVSEKKYIEYFFENLPFMSPCKPIKSSDLDRSRMKHVLSKYAKFQLHPL